MSNPAKILVVDDEAVARRTLKTILEFEGYQVIAVGSGEAALQELQLHNFEVMILDLKMGGISGMDVLERSIGRYPNLRVIVLTAHGSLDTAIQAVRFHLSDYLLKPASPDDILASVRKALAEKPPGPGVAVQENTPSVFFRRKPDEALTLVELAPGIEIDFRRRRIAWGRGTIDLTPTEARLMEVLLKYRKQVVQHSDLVFMVHGYRVQTEEAAKILRPVMSRLRRKLVLLPGAERWIQNVRGAGYLFEVPEPQPGIGLAREE